MSPLLQVPMPETSSGSSHSILPLRVLHREWKAFKPVRRHSYLLASNLHQQYLPKSTSLPALQLLPRDRPRYTCCRCGFVNFYDIPLCVWCGIDSESAVCAFESTMPRTRTASAPPRVFWTLNELGPRAPRSSEIQKNTKERASVSLRDARDIGDARDFGDTLKSERRREHNRTPSAPPLTSTDPSTRHSMMVPPIHTPIELGPGRPQMHKRSHSQPNALRIGHPTRPYYSVIRKDISS
jgi:hypothetical protein